MHPLLHRQGFQFLVHVSDGLLTQDLARFAIHQRDQFIDVTAGADRRHIFVFLTEFAQKFLHLLPNRIIEVLGQEPDRTYVE